MQYLKEEIKNRIIQAALKEFEEKGFQKASILRISSDAGVAIGNIYRYFKNKDELFNYIMEPVYNSFKTLIMDLYGDFETVTGADIDTRDIVKALMELYLRYKSEFLVMLEKSEGSRYKNTKEELIQIVSLRLKKELMPLKEGYGIELQDAFVYVFAATLMEGMLIILKDNVTIEEKEILINRLLIFYFHGLLERLS